MRQTARKFHIRLAALITVFLLLIPVVPTAQAASGTCGDKLKWEVTGSVLTISGKGKMDNYVEGALAPWHDLQITAVTIGKGVTSVGDLAFFDMDDITAVTLADSVKSVGKYAFYSCENMAILELGQGLKTIGGSAFEECSAVMSVRLPNSLESLGQQAFYGCDSLQSITVPKSVTQMGSAVFAYCASLHTAIVNANIQQLPVWTFYGCSALKSVLLNPAIVETGTEAFAGSAMEKPPVRGTVQVEGNITHSTTEKDPQGGNIRQEYEESDNSAISTQTGADGKITVNADLENKNGWDDLNQQLSGSSSTQVNVQLKGEETLPSSTLQQIAGKDIVMQIHTAQGGSWNVKGKDLPLTGWKGSYDLSFKIKQLTKLSQEQKEIFGDCTVFSVTFNGDIDFKTEVVLPLGVQLSRHKAAFYAPVDGKYAGVQQVLMDDNGQAHFYLDQIREDVEYLVGVDVPRFEMAPIIPNSLHQDFGVDQQEEMEYVVLGPKSSWGLDIGQVTWILVGVMGGSVIVVGAVLAILNKRKLKKGYIPELDEE